jgi:hypothetical protein
LLKMAQAVSGMKHTQMPSKIFKIPPRESLVNVVPAGVGKIANLFVTVYSNRTTISKKDQAFLLSLDMAPSPCTPPPP